MTDFATRTLIDVCENYYFPRQPRIRCDKTRDQYRFAIKDLKATLLCEPTVADLQDDNIVAMITRMQRVPYAAKTINERRGRLNALWSFLAKRGHVATWPTTGRIQEPKKTPLAWTRDELKRLLDACRKQAGFVGPVPAAAWWVSLHFVMWDSGERIGALMQAEWSHLQDDWLILPAEIRKGKKSDRAYRLSVDSVWALEMIRQPRRDLIWPFPFHPLSLWPRYKRMRKAAGLSSDHRSAFHRVRRSVATYFEAAGGNATELLGHSDRRVTRDSYLDPRFLETQQAKDKLFRLDRES